MYKTDRKKMLMKMAEAKIGSYKELAARAGISVNTISRLCNGGSAKLSTLQPLAEALNCQPFELLEEA